MLYERGQTGLRLVFVQSVKVGHMDGRQAGENDG